MDKQYCKKIDEELLVEKYVEGKMSREESQKFEHHLKECPVHAQSVMLEKALYRGVSEFARSELRTRLKKSIQKREDLRFYILRYAAILFLVVITPLILYYQFYLPDWAKKQESRIPPSPTSVQTEEEKIPEAIILEEDKSPDVSAGQSDAESSEPETKFSALEGRENIKIRTSDNRSKATEHELPDLPLPPEHELSEQLQIKSASQRLQKMREEKKLVGSGTTRTPVEIPALSESTKIDSDVYNSLELQMKVCITHYINSLSIDPYSLKYSFIIDSTGHATDIKLIDASESVADIDSCLARTIREWQFEKTDQNIAISRQLIVKIK